MKTNSLQHTLVAVLAAVVAVLGSQSAFAQTFTWTDGDFATNPNIWNDAGNWDINTIPNAAGVTATLTFPGGNLGNPLTVDLAATSETVGTLNIGTSDGVAGGTYHLESTGGGTLTLNNSGAGAAINEISTAVGDTITAPIIIADSGGLNITDSATSTTQFQINGGITGTGNLTITNNNPNGSGSPGGNTIVIGGNINSIGTLSIAAGTGTGTVRIQGGVGSNVTQIIQNSATSELYFAGTGITVNSAGTSIIANAAGGMGADGGLGTIGTGNVTLANNTSTSDAASIGGANNIGEVLVNGTGTGLAQVGGNIGSNITELDVLSGSTSGLEFRGGSLTINTTNGFTVLEDDSNVSTATLQNKQSIVGTGDLILKNNSSVNGGVQLDEQSENNTGNVINEGTGTGESSISNTLGGNLLGVVEDSTTSALEFRNSGTAFTGAWKIEAGTMIFSGGNSNFTDGSKIIVGDTAAHGAASFLHLNIDQGGLTMGATQTLSGFGSVTNQSVTAVSGSTIAPGSLGNIGKLTINQNLTPAAGTNLTFALGTATALPATSTSSQLAIGGALTLVAGINLDLLDNADDNGQGSLGAGEYELMSYGSLAGVSGSEITSMFDITAPAGYTYDLSDTGTGAGQIDLTVTAAVPEPGTWAMLLGGLGLLFGMQRLRSRRA